MMTKTKAEAYLQRPYRRVLIPDRETGTYTAEIAEFPGCVAEGKTPTEALRRLEAAAESWIDAVLDARQVVPEPMEEQEYSGKLILRLSRSLHRRAAERAQAEGISLNQFIATTLAEHIGTVAAKTVTTTAVSIPVTLNMEFPIKVLHMPPGVFAQTVGAEHMVTSSPDSVVSSNFAYWAVPKLGDQSMAES